MKRSRGFSLVELILVIVVLGVLAGVITVFVRPAVQGFIAQRHRSELQSAAQGALQAMQRDIRSAVPNSIRTPSDQCFELVPTVGGGRYRMAPDTVNDPATCATAASCSAVLDPASITQRFDVLGPLNGTAALGDFVVVGNQNGNEVYGSSINRSAISATHEAMGNAAFGSQRIAVAPIQFPTGGFGGRFQVVPASEQAVFYLCSAAGLDSAGNGTGQLLRRRAYGFNAAYPSACPAPGGGDAVLATRVSACSFEYSQAALTEYGLMSLRVDLARDGESVSLQLGAMVANIP